jgi:hypothetical protein
VVPFDLLDAVRRAVARERDGEIVAQREHLPTLVRKE